MRLFIYLFLIALGFFFVPAADAQVKNTRTTKPTAKFKPPKLKTSFAKYSDTVALTVDEVKKIAGAKLIITDEKKNAYTVTRYRFLYKRQVQTEDEATGKLYPATTTVSEAFTTTPLPPFWVETISTQLKPREELYFFDIIVKNAQGIVMYAPNLKINVK